MEWVKDYVGIEFENKGRGEKCDCWGLVRRIYQEKFGIALPSFVEYDSANDLREVSAIIRGKEKTEGKSWYPIDEGKEEFGDVAIFKIAGQPVHIGFVLGNRKMLHIEMGIDSCVESYTSLRWQRRIHRFYRHRERL